MLVSIGTGVLVSQDVGKTIKLFFDKLTGMATDTEKSDREFEGVLKDSYGIEQKVYVSFSVQHGKYHQGHLLHKTCSECILATTDEVECLRSLWSSGTYYETQKIQKRTRVPDTYLWALKNPKYIQWRDSNTKKLL